MLSVTFNLLYKLAHKKDKALGVYSQQVKKLNQNPQDKENVIQSEANLRSLAHVKYARNLTPEQQEMMEKNPAQNFITWRTVGIATQ